MHLRLTLECITSGLYLSVFELGHILTLTRVWPPSLPRFLSGNMPNPPKFPSAVICLLIHCVIEV